MTCTQINYTAQKSLMVVHFFVLSMVFGLMAGFLSPAMAGSPVHLRINTAHGLSNALGAVTDAGLSAITDVIITPSSELNGRPFIPPDKFISDAQSVQATIMSSSFSGWEHLFDTVLYPQLSKNNLVHVFAYEPRKPQPPGVPPPAVFVTANICGGKTGDGIEFGISKGYMSGRGQSDTPSGVTAQLAGLMASMKYTHQEWNWFDVKSALRMTASNFQSGYDPKASGYGCINYPAANALTDAHRFPLFPPASLMRLSTNNTVIFAVNSFKQSRRVTDALFKFRMRPIPKLKDLSLDEITALGGQLLYTGDRSETNNSLSVRVADNEMTFFVWLSKDAKGVYSRIEPYSILGPVLFTPQPAAPLYGPRIDRLPHKK
ncbi:MAG: hypothetical protein PHI31_00325 [Desulfuromonadaceae bacterium]|nr:hypothetical protein [Desulfuromonadaceae bacterium]